MCIRVWSGSGECVCVCTCKDACTYIKQSQCEGKNSCKPNLTKEPLCYYQSLQCIDAMIILAQYSKKWKKGLPNSELHNFGKHSHRLNTQVTNNWHALADEEKAFLSSLMCSSLLPYYSLQSFVNLISSEFLMNQEAKYDLGKLQSQRSMRKHISLRTRPSLFNQSV